MRVKLINIALIAAFASVAMSCNDFLDEMPDNRTLIDTPEKVTDLLNTAYPTANYSLMAEFSADNFIDNMAVNSAGISQKVASFDRMDEEIFAWEDVKSNSSEDSPYDLWETYYKSIAVANHALAAIDKIAERDNSLMKKMIPQKGEALVLRAYCHFVLANLFCQAYKDPVTSMNDLGIPYATEPETVVFGDYERGSVTDVYNKIGLDIEAGIGLINDQYYKVPKYHFNEKAAHAFAARYYLYAHKFDKVIEHASIALGTTSVPSTPTLRDWTGLYSNTDVMAFAYINAENPANLMLLPTTSVFERRFNKKRFGCTDRALKGSIEDRGPTWSGRPSFLQGWVWVYDEKTSVFIPKISEMFEFTDKVAQIGYAHIVRTEFTTDEALLNRAEAYIYLNRIDDAINDLQAWNASHRMTQKLTAGVIKGFYVDSKPDFSKPFNVAKMRTEFIVTEEQKPFLDCVLHFRRLERVFEGDRWFDIKRYGIELTHYFGDKNERLTLSYDDARRAFQIPLDVAGAGIESNPRPAKGGESPRQLP